jgi:hypothetical protein
VNKITIQFYSEESLNTIKNCNFLEKNDFQQLEQLKSELQNTFEKKQIWRTETEMRISILNDLNFPTKASKYWQAVREQSVFFENLVILSFDYRKNNVKIKQKENEIKKCKDELEKELKQIELEELLYGKKNMEIAAKDRMREIKLWSKIKNELNDGTFDDQNVNSHQLVSYGQRFVQEVMNIKNSPNIGVAEINNLLGQLYTTMKKAKEENVVNDILKILPNDKRLEIINFMVGQGEDFNKYLLEGKICQQE